MIALFSRQSTHYGKSRLHFLLSSCTLQLDMSSVNFDLIRGENMNKFKYIVLFVICNSFVNVWAYSHTQCNMDQAAELSYSYICCKNKNSDDHWWVPNAYPKDTCISNNLDHSTICTEDTALREDRSKTLRDKCKGAYTIDFTK
ncbi:MAG TPA: hypothetical protein VKR58_01455 [Aquella sp.]|nr:hypothetical protein [Aquella sp.]